MARVRAFRVSLVLAGIALLGFVWAVPWHSISPPGAIVIVFIAGLLLFFGLRRG
jgi:nitrogen fixation-related uncharacterized protein